MTHKEFPTVHLHSPQSLIHRLWYILLNMEYYPCCCCQVASVVSDSVQPHRWKSTRFLRPWDSPGKNTGVGFHFLLQCMKVKRESEVAQLCLTLCDPMDYTSHRFLHPWDFPGKSTGVGCHCLLQVLPLFVIKSKIGVSN